MCHNVTYCELADLLFSAIFKSIVKLNLVNSIGLIIHRPGRLFLWQYLATDDSLSLPYLGSLVLRLGRKWKDVYEAAHKAKCSSALYKRKMAASIEWPGIRSIVQWCPNFFQRGPRLKILKHPRADYISWSSLSGENQKKGKVCFAFIILKMI